MQRALYILLALAVFSALAHIEQLTPMESKLVGDWSIPRRTELTDGGFAGATRGHDVTSLKADHKMSQTSYPIGMPPALVLSGTWRADGKHLVLKFTWAHASMQDMVGQELGLVISDLQPNSFVSANAQN